jgi:hypothetical protein
MNEGWFILILLFVIFLFEGDPDLWDALADKRDSYIQEVFDDA